MPCLLTKTRKGENMKYKIKITASDITEFKQITEKIGKFPPEVANDIESAEKGIVSIYHYYLKEPTTETKIFTLPDNVNSIDIKDGKIKASTGDGSVFYFNHYPDSNVVINFIKQK
jgi:hypothetical protein